MTLRAMIGIAFDRRLELSIPRIILLVGLTWMALTHVRNIEIFAFPAPLVVAAHRGAMGSAESAASRGQQPRSAAYITILSSIAIVMAGWVGTFVTYHPFAFAPLQTPVAAVDLLEKRYAQRIFSTASSGGYLISRDIKVFIDGRAELYGEQFVLHYFDATEARNLGVLPCMLDSYRIDATLLNATSPAAYALDHVEGWKRLYADDIAVIHDRTDKTEVSRAPASEAVD